MLDLNEAIGGGRVGYARRQQHAERAIEFIDTAHSLDAQRVLAHARAVSQASGAVITGASNDLGKSMSHGSTLLQRGAHAAIESLSEHAITGDLCTTIVEQILHPAVQLQMRVHSVAGE